MGDGYASEVAEEQRIVKVFIGVLVSSLVFAVTFAVLEVPESVAAGLGFFAGWNVCLIDKASQ